MLLAGLTLLPALLSICGRAVFWPSRGRSREPTTDSWWADVAQPPPAPPGTDARRRPAACSAAWLSPPCPTTSGGFGGAVNAPAGSDAAIGNSILVRDFPQASVNPTNVIMTFSSPVWDHPADLATAETVLRHSGEFTSLDGPLDPNGVTLSPARVHPSACIARRPGSATGDSPGRR